MALAEKISSALKLLLGEEQAARLERARPGQSDEAYLKSVLEKVEDRIAVMERRGALARERILDMSRRLKEQIDEYQALAEALEDLGREMVEDEIIDREKEIESESVGVREDRHRIGALRKIRDAVRQGVRAQDDELDIDLRGLSTMLAEIQEGEVVRRDQAESVTLVRGSYTDAGDADAERRRKLRERLGSGASAAQRPAAGAAQRPPAGGERRAQAIP